MFGQTLLHRGHPFTLWTSNANSILQLNAPDHLRGRVVSLYLWAFAGLAPVGGLFTGSRSPAAAVTVGDTIVVHPAATLSPELVRHELEHVRQWREDGWRFPIRYAVQYARHGYRANPYEVAAREAERERS